MKSIILDAQSMLAIAIIQCLCSVMCTSCSIVVGELIRHTVAGGCQEEGAEINC